MPFIFDFFGRVDAAQMVSDNLHNTNHYSLHLYTDSGIVWGGSGPSSPPTEPTWVGYSPMALVPNAVLATLGGVGAFAYFVPGPYTWTVGSAGSFPDLVGYYLIENSTGQIAGGGFFDEGPLTVPPQGSSFSLNFFYELFFDNLP